MTTGIDLEGTIMLSEMSQMEKDKNHMISLICGTENKKVTNKQKQTQRHRHENGGYRKGREWGGRIGGRESNSW